MKNEYITGRIKLELDTTAIGLAIGYTRDDQCFIIWLGIFGITINFEGNE